MFQTTFLTGLAAIFGTAGSILLLSFVRNIAPQIQLAIAASIGALCSSILVCRENSIRRKIRDARDEKKKKKSSALLRIMLFWLVFICGIAAATVAALKMLGRL
jgi:hypothetical protein